MRDERAERESGGREWLCEIERESKLRRATCVSGFVSSHNWGERPKPSLVNLSRRSHGAQHRVGVHDAAMQAGSSGMLNKGGPRRNATRTDSVWPWSQLVPLMLDDVVQRYFAGGCALLCLRPRPRANPFLSEISSAGIRPRNWCTHCTNSMSRDCATIRLKLTPRSLKSQRQDSRCPQLEVPLRGHLASCRSH